MTDRPLAPKAGAQPAAHPKTAAEEEAERIRIEAAVASEFQVARVAEAMERAAPSLGVKIDALARQNDSLAQQIDTLARQSAAIEQRNDALKSAVEQILTVVTGDREQAPRAAEDGNMPPPAANDRGTGYKRGGSGATPPRLPPK